MFSIPYQQVFVPLDEAFKAHGLPDLSELTNATHR